MAVGISGLDPVSPGGLRAASVPLATGRILPWARQLCREGPPGLMAALNRPKSSVEQNRADPVATIN